MAKSRLSKRREAEAAEALEEAAPAKKKKKKAAKKKATRKKATTSRSRRAKDVAPRRRLIWVVYSSTMREEGRYPYHERNKAEEKLEQLLAKGKRRYFIQPIKEPLDSEGNPMTEEVTPPVKKAATKKAEASSDGEETPKAEAEE